MASRPLRWGNDCAVISESQEIRNGGGPYRRLLEAFVGPAQHSSDLITYWLGSGSKGAMYDADGTKLPPREHWAPDPWSVNLPLNTGHLQLAVSPPWSRVHGAVIQAANGAFEQVVTGA